MDSASTESQGTAGASSRDWLGWLGSLRPRVLLSIALGIAFLLMLPGLMEDSCTFDEGTHLVAGYAAWTRFDFRLSPDNPPLARLLEALPLLYQEVHWPSRDDNWRQPSPWDFAFQFLYASGNDPDRLLFFSRLIIVLLTLVLIAAIYEVARRHSGPQGGLVALALAAFSPSLLAHGHLCTIDIAASLAIFIAVIAFRDFLAAPTLARGALSGLTLGIALATKFSAFALFPIMLLMGISKAIRAKREPSAFPSSTPRNRRVLAWSLFALVPYLFLWGCYGFRYAATSDPTFDFPWETVEFPDHLWSLLANQARRFHALPEAYVFGFKLMQRNTAAGHPAFALGQWSMTGWGWYFPFALLVKTPVAALGLMAAGGWAWGRRLLSGRTRDDSPWIAVGVYLALAMGKNMNIGLRHVLPILPFFFVLAGEFARPSEQKAWEKWRLRLAPALLALAALEAIAAFPHYLPYFNAPARCLGEPYELLADSNLDWGQDLGLLKKFMDRRGIPTLKLSYFGAASPRHLKLSHETLPGLHLYSSQEPEWVPAGELEAGDIVAVSASHLSGLFLDDRDFYRRRLGKLRPLAVLGGSIYVYRVPGTPP